FVYVPDVSGIESWTAIGLPEGINLEDQWIQNGEEMIFRIDTNLIETNLFDVRIVGIPEFNYAITRNVVFGVCPHKDLNLPAELRLCNNYPRAVELTPLRIPGSTYS